MQGFSDILQRLYEMTAIGSLGETPAYLLMYFIAFLLLYLGIVCCSSPLPSGC